jgi:hypothetical protein
MSDQAASTARRFLQTIWPSEPEDLRRLRSTSLPPGGKWSGVLFCDLILLWSAQVLGLQRSLALNAQVPLDALVDVVAAELRQMADWLAHWQMSDSVAFLRQVASELETDRPADEAEVARALEGILLVVNRTQNWIDGFVPWAQLDERLPLIDAEHAPGNTHA